MNLSLKSKNAQIVTKVVEPGVRTIQVTRRVSTKFYGEPKIISRIKLSLFSDSTSISPWRVQYLHKYSSNSNEKYMNGKRYSILVSLLLGLNIGAVFAEE